MRVLIEAGADPRAGEPNAIASARMFGRTDKLGNWVCPRANLKARPRCRDCRLGKS